MTAKELKATDYTIIIPNLVYQQVMWWINMTEMEVSGFGSVEVNHEAKTYTVLDVFLPKQVNMPTSSEIDPEALGKHMYERRDIPNHMKWHWHSHVNMGVFWSGDDMNIIRGLGHRDWVIASVFNKKREVRSAYMTTVELNGQRHEIFEDEMLTHVHNPLPSELITSWEAEFKAAVKEKNYYAGTKVTIPSSSGGDMQIDMLPHHRQEMPGAYDIKIPGQVVSDEFGYFVDDEGEYVYNPLTDKYCYTDEDRYQSLMELENKELNESIYWFPEIDTFMNNHHAKQMTGGAV